MIDLERRNNNNNNNNLYKLHPKIKKITKKANDLLLSDLDEKNTLSEIKKIFTKLIKFSKTQITKIKTEEDFITFLRWFEQIFKELDIAKLYNSTNRWDYKSFDNLDLFMQFFYIATPLMTTKNFSFIKWWVCYHWSLFFNNLFTEIDKNNKLSKNLILFNLPYNHWVFQIWFKNKKFIIDPYAKKNWLITEVKEGNEMYLTNSWKNAIYWKIIENDQEIILKTNVWILKPKIYTKKINYIDNIKVNDNEFINIKTYKEWKPIHIIINDSDSDIIITYRWRMFSKDKEFSIIDLVWLYMEKKKVKKIDMLFALTWFWKNGKINKDILSEFNNLNESEIIDEFKILAEKINTDYLFKKLKIDKDIEMMEKM